MTTASLSLQSLQQRLAPAEDLFFTWLMRVVVAATLTGVAWIDDAPPLEIAAYLITLYVVLRVLMQAPAFYAAAPFAHPALKGLCALFSLLLLGLAFPSVAIFVNVVAQAALGQG